MRATATEFKHSQLFAGEANYVIRLKSSKAEYKPGTILVSKDGKKYAPAKAGDIAVPKVAGETPALTQAFFAVAIDTVSAADNDEVVCVKEGYFNKSVIEAANTAGIITDDAIEILKTHNIFIKDVAEQ